MEYIIYRYSVNTIFKYIKFFGKCSVCVLQKKKKIRTRLLQENNSKLLEIFYNFF